MTYLFGHVLHGIFGIRAQLELAAGIACGQDLVTQIFDPQDQFSSAAFLDPLEILLQVL